MFNNANAQKDWRFNVMESRQNCSAAIDALLVLLDNGEF